jgi:hypothetical protein
MRQRGRGRQIGFAFSFLFVAHARACCLHIISEFTSGFWLTRDELVVNDGGEMEFQG